MGGLADQRGRAGRDSLRALPPPAATLDHRAGRRDFVSAVDVDGNVADVVQLLDVDAVLLQPFRGAGGARDRALDPVLDPGQLVDEAVRRGTGADADPRVVDDVAQRLARDQLFLFVLGHRSRSRRSFADVMRLFLHAFRAVGEIIVWVARSCPSARVQRP